MIFSKYDFLLGVVLVLVYTLALSAMDFQENLSNRLEFLSISNDEISTQTLQSLMASLTPCQVVDTIRQHIEPGKTISIAQADIVACALTLNLLDKKKTFFDVKDQDGMNPFHIACSHGYGYTLDVLLGTCSDKKQAVLKQDNFFRNLFYVAARANHVKLLKKFLYEMNFDVDEIKSALLVRAGKYGYTALHAAVWRGNTEIVLTLLDWAVTHECIWDLLTAKAHDGTTPLHVASENKRGFVVELLLIAADKRCCEYIEIKDNNGKTAEDFFNCTALALRKEHLFLKIRDYLEINSNKQS